MRRVLLPGTDLACSPVGIGTWGLSGPNDLGGLSLGWPVVPGPARVVEAALEAGISLFDTADFYGKGEAETLLGQVLSGETGAVVATKVGLLPYLQPGTKEIARDFSGSHVERAIEASLRRLRRSSLDLLYLHGPGNEILDKTDTWDALERLKASGAVRYLGVSLGRSEGVGSALDRWLANPLISVVQLEYSVRYPARAQQIDLSGGTKAILARSVLNHGLLLPETRNRPLHPSDHRRHKLDDHCKTLLSSFDASEPIRGQSNRSMLEVALRYALDSPTISAVIAGATSPRQVLEIATACETPTMDSEERDELQKLALSAFGTQGVG
jgi:aryl-alcohol dehydrogenase-like predicted oxidoreductase